MINPKTFIPLLIVGGLVALAFYSGLFGGGAVNNEKTGHPAGQDEFESKTSIMQQEKPGALASEEQEGAGKKTGQGNNAPDTSDSVTPVPAKGEQAGSESSITVSDIEKLYRPKFLALKNEYDAKINNLAAQGMSEYRSYKNNNEDPPVLKLASKYLKAGNALEAECDSKFNTVLVRMKQDLLEAGLPLDLVKQVKSEYKSQKAERKKRLIQSGLKFIGG